MRNSKILLIICIILMLGCANLDCGPSLTVGAGPLFYPDGKIDPWSLTPGIKCKF